MAEAQAAAPAPAAAPEGGKAPAGVTDAGLTPPAAKKDSSLAAPTPAPAVPKAKRGTAKHEEIRAKLAASKKTETPAAAAPDGKPAEAAKADDGKPAETKPEAEKPKPAVGAVMRLTAENTKLKADLDDLKAKLETASKGESVASLREKVKKDPAILLDVFGEDIGEDVEKRLARLADAALERNDPARAAERERDERVAKLERERDAEKAENARLKSADRDAKAREHTAKVLTEGHKGEDGTLVIDPAKYPAANALAKAGIVDSHLGIMLATRDLAADFRKEKGREPTEPEIVTMIRIAADEAETHFAEQAKKWVEVARAMGLVPAQASVAAEPEPRAVPTTIGSQFGRRSPGMVDTSRLSKAERHELIRQKYRASLNQLSSN